MAIDESWVTRTTLVDLYPRKDDPFRPPSAVAPSTGPAASLMTDQQIQDAYGEGNPILLTLTQPGQRPIVYQRAANFQMTAGVTPIPLQISQFQCDSIVIDVPTTAANSVFFGFGNGVSVTSGIECRPGLPISLEADNTREQWELQRQLEFIAAMMAIQLGFPGLSQYKAPRVVFDASQWYVVAAANTVLSIMLLMVPEQQ